MGKKKSKYVDLSVNQTPKLKEFNKRFGEAFIAGLRKGSEDFDPDWAGDISREAYEKGTSKKG